MKPVILGAGSCIIGHFLKGVRELSGSEEEYEFVIALGKAGDREPLAPDVLSRCRVLIEEATPWQRMLSEAEQTQLAAECAQIRVPTIHFNSLWPLMIADPRNKPEPGIPWGMIPFNRGDRLALEIMRSEADPGKWLDTYFAADLSRVVNVERNHAMELENMFARERGCDVHVAAYVVSHFRDKRLFYTHHHPGPDLLAFALTQILAHPATRAIQRRPFAQIIDQVYQWTLSLQAPFQNEAAPIHPQVARTFNLAWYAEDLRYPWLGTHYTFEDWIRFYFAYKSTEQTETPEGWQGLKDRNVLENWFVGSDS